MQPIPPPPPPPLVLTAAAVRETYPAWQPVVEASGIYDDSYDDSFE